MRTVPAKVKPKFTQLPLIPDTPGMEPEGTRTRRRPMSPGEREMEDALRISDETARTASVRRIEQRAIAFKNAWYTWQNVHRHETVDPNNRRKTLITYDGCARCDGKLTEACLLYQDKAYCASCRNEVWNDMGKRVGLYL